jgi:hypothetical protein
MTSLLSEKKSFEIQNGFISVPKRVNFQDETAIK